MSASRRPIILNVDDTEAQRYAITRTLENAGFVVWQAASGEEALQQVARRPDLVILDVNLPDVSGFEVCRRIKDNPQTAVIPVLHQSAMYVDSHARITALEGGADAYLVHPIEPGELLATVRALLRLCSVESKLRESEARYRQMFELSPLPCWLFDIETLRFLELNGAASRAYGYSREEFLNLTLEDIRLPEEVPTLQEIRERAFDRPVITRHRRKDGRVIDVEGSWRLIQVDGRECGLAIFADVTERNRAAEFAAAERVRRELLRRTILAQEEERRRISRELHDEAGQLLASLLVGLRTISGANRIDEAKKRAKQLRTITHRAMDELGKIARGLHPTALDDFGLTVALERHLQEYEETHGLRVGLKTGRVKASRLPGPVQVGLYRIIQEALTNVARHAGARHVTVRLKSLRQAVQATIADDGKGFRWAEEKQGGNGHFGLQSMRERAELLGGELEVASSSQGTIVTATIPIRSLDAASNTS
ncbi:MAG TPA: response regulator [Candidatus Nanoarchaeia archaeon]|nr:response regulator [Candidatus Nanoarchaeia archaeon]